MIAAKNAFCPIESPMSNLARYVGVTSNAATTANTALNRNTYSTIRFTSMPSTRAASVFCATACIARPVTVLFRNICKPMTMSPASTSVPMSAYEIAAPPSEN